MLSQTAAPACYDPQWARGSEAPRRTGCVLQEHETWWEGGFAKDVCPSLGARESVLPWFIEVPLVCNKPACSTYLFLSNLRSLNSTLVVYLSGWVSFYLLAISVSCLQSVKNSEFLSSSNKTMHFAVSYYAGAEKIRWALTWNAPSYRGWRPHALCFFFILFVFLIRTLGAWLAGTARPPLPVVGQGNSWEHRTNGAISFLPSSICSELHWRHFPLGNDIRGSPGLFGLGLWGGLVPGAAQAQAPPPNVALVGFQGLSTCLDWEEECGLLALSWHLFHEMKAFYSCFIWIHLWKPHFVFP